MSTSLSEFLAAATQGDAGAQATLGHMYLTGTNAPCNRALALQWLKRAATQGHTTAQFNIAQMYGHGVGVVKNESLAITMYQHAAARGHAKSIELLKTLATPAALTAQTPNPAPAPPVPPDSPAAPPAAPVHQVKSGVRQSVTHDPVIYWHGSVSGDLRGGNTGLHLGTKLAATQALEARIGVPAEGEWDGTREYGKTLLAGSETLAAKEKERGHYLATGANAQVSSSDYLPTPGVMKYPDGTPVPMDVKPSVHPFRLNTKMSNTSTTPHEDFKANGYMSAQKKKGIARRGYYYQNVSEDDGSISVVVPDGSHVIPATEITRSAARDQTDTPEFKKWFGDTQEINGNFRLPGVSNIDVVAEIDGPVAIYSWSGDHTGKTRGALRLLQAFGDGTISVKDPGEPGTDSYSYWERMFSDGLVTSLYDSEDNLLKSATGNNGDFDGTKDNISQAGMRRRA